MAANDKDNWALNQKSLLLTADGKVAEAIELLRKSYAIGPENGETRYLLVDALLAGLESDFDRYLPLATEFEPIMESQRFRFLVMLARGNLKAGQYELAFSRLMELVRERSTSRQPGLQVRLQTMTLAPGHQVDIDSWIAVHLGMVFDKAPPELKTENVGDHSRSHESCSDQSSFSSASRAAFHDVARSSSFFHLDDGGQFIGWELIKPKPNACCSHCCSVGVKSCALRP